LVNFQSATDATKALINFKTATDVTKALVNQNHFFSKIYVFPTRIYLAMDVTKALIINIGQLSDPVFSLVKRGSIANAKAEAEGSQIGIPNL
jgi:hypothetical protein